MSVSYQEILNALPRLTVEQRQQVKLRLVGANMVNGGAASAPATLSSDDKANYVLLGITYQLRRMGVLGADGSIPQRAITNQHRADLAAATANLDRFVGQLSGVEKAALGQLAARCLAEWLDKRNIPVSINTMLNNCAKVPLALDDCFPGYLCAGLLKFCWAAR
jgi:hypothetical protein